MPRTAGRYRDRGYNRAVTLGPSLRRLLSVGSSAIAHGRAFDLPRGRLGRELGELLEQRNGFLAFGSALLVRGCGEEPGNLLDWNRESGWRATYCGMADGLFFFAEDVLGGQFALMEDQVLTFDPETGERAACASSLEDWADQLFADVEVWTGSPLAEAWQTANGPLPYDKRLVPKIPFILGGDYSIENLYLLDSKLGMKVRGDLAVQVRDLPDGAQVSYRVVD